MTGRRLLALTALVVGLFPVPAGAATSSVSEGANYFSPKQLTVTVGDTVVWTYRSSASGPGHTVTFDDGTDLDKGCEPNTLLPFNCQNTASPTRSFTFTSPGRFPYYCKIHGGPGGQGMSGVVIVTAAATTATTAPNSSTTTTVRSSSSTTTTRAASSSTTSTTRQLATSSTVVRSSTTTLDTSSALAPGAPPSLGGDSSSAAGKKSDSGGGKDHEAVALIVGLLLAVSAGGGYLLWRLRPSRP